MKLKIVILDICFAVNLLLFVLYIFVILAAVFSTNDFFKFFTSDAFLYIRGALAVPILILWVNALIAWYRFEKNNIGQFLLLFFFNGFYPPFYYLRMKKNGWI